MRKSLLLFLAAGSSVALGLPSTGDLTQAIVSRLSSPRGYCGNQSQQHFDALTTALKETFDTPNFEHYQHGLEALASLKRSWNECTEPPFRVIEAALTAGPHKTFPVPIDSLWLIQARTEFFRVLHQTLIEPDSRLTTQPNWQTFTKFLQMLDKEFDLYVVTTNYDTAVEQALGWGPSEQGFEPVSGASTLRYAGQATLPKLMHIHGSIHFGYRKAGEGLDRNIFEDDHEDLYFHVDKTADANWPYRSGQTTQSGRDVPAGPIITGLQKPDKLLPEPYLSYYRQFLTLSVQVPHVMIVGYGFGDFHLNASFSRFSKWHGDQRRIVMIDHCDPNKWTPSSTWDYAGKRKYRIIARMAEQEDALNVPDYPDPWVPEKIAAGHGRFEAYFRGMIETIERHGDRIIDFLKS